MKTIDKLSFVPLLALLLFAGSCEKDGGVFMRENDAIACDCTEQSISQNVLCDGEWVADCGDVGWIAITPERGSGNGKDFTLNIQYNSGAERTATVHLVYDGAAYPITVTQGACEFAYGEPRVEGNLFRNIESTATLRLPYVCASGRESVEISCTITGAAADGLSVTKQVYTGFAKGSGELTIPVEGAATRAGAVAFELFADGVSVGSCARRAPGGVEFLCARHDGHRTARFGVGLQLDDRCDSSRDRYQSARCAPAAAYGRQRECLSDGERGGFG